MEWPEYKLLCDQPDYWSHWMLNRCIELIVHQDAQDLVAAIQQSLAGHSLDRPKDHKGPQSTFMYHFPLSLPLSEILLVQIQQAQSCNKTKADSRASGLGGFVAACQELVIHNQVEAVANTRAESAFRA